MKKTLIIFPDTNAMADFIFSRQLCSAEANSKEFTVVAIMGADDVIDAVTDHKGHLNEYWPPLHKQKAEDLTDMS